MSKKRDKREEAEEDEVRVKKIRILGAIAGTIVAAVFYIGIPYFMNEYICVPEWKVNINEYLPELDLSKIDITWDNIRPMFDRWLYAGIPMVVLGMLTWMMPKGSRQRFVMSTIYLAGSIVWLLYVLNFGDLRGLISVTYDGNTFELGIVLTFILYLMVLFRALKFLIIFGVYKDSRDKYLDGE